MARVPPSRERRRAGSRGIPRPQREEQMLEVAAEVFGRRGFHAASMDEVAEGADVSKPMLYAYFGSKQGLYLAVLRRAGHSLLHRMSRLPAEEPDPLRRLQAAFDAFFSFVDEQREGWKVLYKEMAGPVPAVAEEVAELRAGLTGMLAGLLRELGAEDRVGSEAQAHALIGAGEALANWWLVHPEVDRATVSARLLRLASGVH